MRRRSDTGFFPQTPSHKSSFSKYQLTFQNTNPNFKLKINRIPKRNYLKNRKVENIEDDMPAQPISLENIGMK